MPSSRIPSNGETQALRSSRELAPAAGRLAPLRYPVRFSSTGYQFHSRLLAAKQTRIVQLVNRTANEREWTPMNHCGTHFRSRELSAKGAALRIERFSSLGRAARAAPLQKLRIHFAFICVHSRFPAGTGVQLWQLPGLAPIVAMRYDSAHCISRHEE